MTNAKQNFSYENANNFNAIEQEPESEEEAHIKFKCRKNVQNPWGPNLEQTITLRHRITEIISLNYSSIGFR